MKNSDTGAQGATAAALDSAAVDQTNQGQAPVIPFNRYISYGQRWPVPARGEILVIPLGGLGRIGMNWTLYGHNGRWLLVDAGLAFPSRDMEGVDAIVPDPAALASILPYLDGLVVTHAHEDHIGAIDKLWPGSINCPIWASPFAADLIARRLEEAETRDAVDLRVFQVGETLQVGAFRVRTVRMTHSIPEPVLLAIETPAGTMVHTGDWKIDATPVVGLPPDYDALKEIGDAGVLALLSDSTNAQRPGKTGSEAEVAEAFRRLFAIKRGMVVVCCFSSNIARIASAADAAEASGRKIAIAGRSMRCNEESARRLGLMENVPEFLAEPSHLGGLARHEMAMVCTGGQGDERAALNRLANGDWRLPRLEHGDTVVLSGSTIPGNEGPVGSIVARLKKRGVEVILPRDLIDGYPVQVSGHPNRDDLETLYGLLRPRFAIPLHADYHHQEAHACLARVCGVETATCAEEGEVLKLTARRGVSVIGRVETPVLHIARPEDEQQRRRGGRRR